MEKKQTHKSFARLSYLFFLLFSSYRSLKSKEQIDTTFKPAPCHMYKKGPCSSSFVAIIIHTFSCGSGWGMFLSHISRTGCQAGRATECGRNFARFPMITSLLLASYCGIFSILQTNSSKQTQLDIHAKNSTFVMQCPSCKTQI